MARKKTEEVVPAVGAVETIKSTKKTPRKPRTKKNVAVTAATTEKPACKPRAPRQKKVVTIFMIQNGEDEGISYASTVEKVQFAVVAQDVSSSDIYVKAEKGKAYYVVNGEASGTVNLFLD